MTRTKIQEELKQIISEKKENTMEPEKQGKIFGRLLIEMEKAEKKHPVFLDVIAPQIILEELGELAHAYNDYLENRLTDEQMSEKVKEEASHVAVTAMRLLEKYI